MSYQHFQFPEGNPEMDKITMNDTSLSSSTAVGTKKCSHSPQWSFRMSTKLYTWRPFLSCFSKGIKRRVACSTIDLKYTYIFKKACYDIHSSPTKCSFFGSTVIYHHKSIEISILEILKTPHQAPTIMTLHSTVYLTVLE